MSWNLFSRQSGPVTDKRAINAWEKTYERLYPDISDEPDKLLRIFMPCFPNFKAYLQGRHQTNTPAQLANMRGGVVNEEVLTRMNAGLDQLSLRIIKFFREFDEIMNRFTYDVEKKDSVYAFMDDYHRLKDKVLLLQNMRWCALAMIEGGMRIDTQQRETLPAEQYRRMPNNYLALTGYRGKILKVRAGEMQDTKWYNALEEDWKLFAGAFKNQVNETFRLIDQQRRR